MTLTVDDIWKEFRDKLFRFILKRIGDISISEDILQDVFLKIYKGINTFKTGSNLDGWVYRITRNSITDYYRSRKISSELPEVSSKPEKSRTQLAKEETQNRIVRLIEHLAEPYRTALLLSDIQQLSQKEVADKMGVTLSCAKSRIRRGRIKLKQYLFTCCHIELDHQGNMLDCEPNLKTVNSKINS